jgi:CheY-like chemotaxis protein
MNAKKILIIDDDPVIANIYQTKFQVEGYEAELAGDGDRALEMLRKAPPDLVFLDLSLPGMSGVEVLKLIRSSPETHAVPVIVFTNTHLPSLVQTAWKAGATKCLSKANYTPREVVDLVNKLLAAGRVGEISATPSPALRLPAGTATAGVVSPGQSDLKFQDGLVGTFLTSAPQTLTAMRHCYQTFLKPGQENLRLAKLHELYGLTRKLTGAAGLAGFKKIAQMASALEALLNELHARPADITPSTNRTIAQAVDKLALLVAHASTLIGQAETPESPLILVVDDDGVSREIIVRAINRVGLRALSLDNSTLALQVLEQNQFDLIFLDIQMPTPDGIETCDRLRKLPLNRTTPVVFVTARSDFESRVKTSSSGGNDFITKPVLVLELAVKTLTWLFNEDLKPLALVVPNPSSPQKNYGRPPVPPVAMPDNRPV